MYHEGGSRYQDVSACESYFRQWVSKLIVKSADTDVEMLAIYFENFIAAHCIYYGVQKIEPASLFIDTKAISDSLGPDGCKVLPGPHALTRCDSTSAFVGKGKQAAFKIMHRSEENQSALQHLGESFELAEEVYWKGLFASYMEKPVEMSTTCVTSCFGFAVPAASSHERYSTKTYTSC